MARKRTESPKGVGRLLVIGDCGRRGVPTCPARPDRASVRARSSETMLSPDSKPPGSSGKKETVYSDRFVPSRTASAGLREFSLLDAAVPPVSAAHPSSEREVRHLRDPFARAFRAPLTRRRATTPAKPGSPRTDAPTARPTARHAGSEPSLKQRVFTRARRNPLLLPDATKPPRATPRAQKLGGES